MSYDGKYQTAVDISGRVYISNNYGSTWTKVKEIIKIPYLNVSVSGDGKYQTLFVTGGIVLKSDDYGNTWKNVLSNKQWFGTSTSYEGKYQLLCEYSGYLYISDNYGTNWTSINVPVQNWSSVCMTRGNITFVDENISTSQNIINITPVDNKPPQNITIPIMPNYDIVSTENQSIVSTNNSNIINPATPPSTPPATPPSTPPATPPSTPSNNSDFNILYIIIPLVVLISLFAGYYFYKKKQM